MEENVSIANGVRKKVFAIMNKTRDDFDATPSYDDFLELREDTVLQMIQTLVQGTMSKAEKDDLNKKLEDYKMVNQEQITRSETSLVDRNRTRIQNIINAEGIIYERINAEFGVRDEITQHPYQKKYENLLQIDEYSTFTIPRERKDRKTRLILTGLEKPRPPVPISSTQLAATACQGLWERRAEESIRLALSAMPSYAESLTL